MKNVYDSQFIEKELTFVRRVFKSLSKWTKYVVETCPDPSLVSPSLVYYKQQSPASIKQLGLQYQLKTVNIVNNDLIRKWHLLIKQPWKGFERKV